MLICDEVTRDVLCLELIDLVKCIQAQPCAMSNDMMSHVRNMAGVLMSSSDFIQVPGLKRHAMEGR